MRAVCLLRQASIRRRSWPRHSGRNHHPMRASVAAREGSAERLVSRERLNKVPFVMPTLPTESFRNR